MGKETNQLSKLQDEGSMECQLSEEVLNCSSRIYQLDRLYLVLRTGVTNDFSHHRCNELALSIPAGNGKFYSTARSITAGKFKSLFVLESNEKEPFLMCNNWKNVNSTVVTIRMNLP